LQSCGVKKIAIPLVTIRFLRYISILNSEVNMSQKTTMQKSLMLGDIAPDFEAETTMGKISFHQWIGDGWCILFSHPKDFTPVCTTELGKLAKMKPEFDKRNIKIMTISLDSIENHKKWQKDIEETQKSKVNYPMIGDNDRRVAELYGMIHPASSENSTARMVIIIDPKKKVRMMLTYPQSTGRNFDEILRVIDSIQLTESHLVATPADWKSGQDCIILPSITDPSVMKQKFPKGWKEIKPYLRMTPQPDNKQ
jgi:alkyl hydroperoxide reductase subunit AhpC